MTRSLLVLLFAASCASPSEDVGYGEEAIVVCPGAATVEGIDVSHWQSTVDWDAVAGDGIEFAFIRVSHGTSTTDTQFARNWPEARRVGVMHGVYQFFSAADDPIEQADLLIEAIGGAHEPGDLPPVLDVEGESVDGQSAATIIANMQTWLDYVEAELGVRPIIYTAKYFWRDTLGDPDFTGYPLWVANYGVTCPDLPAPWPDFHFWQYTSTGSVAGVGGNVDRNVWNGDLDALLAFAAAVPSCGDGVCSGGEDAASCAVDCPVCETIPPLGRTVDEPEVCFTRGGDPMYLRDESAGYGGSLVWTHTTDFAAASNFGVWTLTFDEGGRYLLEAYTAAPFGESTQAIYQVRHAGAEISRSSIRRSPTAGTRSASTISRRAAISGCASTTTRARPRRR
jgi:GH25 family lysozyme M1 (1,4-beta-N-acetylmuramidase)